MNLSSLKPMCVQELVDFGFDDLHDIDKDV